MSNTLSTQIESLLFATADPQSKKALASRLGVTGEAITEALGALETSLEGHAMMLVTERDEVALVTRPEHSAIIETIRKEELSKELSKASSETLSIVAYYAGVSKAQVEFIRGVNASYSLRALSMRGLIEARGTGRSVGYYPTIQLLEHFGVSTVAELPAYTETSKKITTLLTQDMQSE